MAGLIEQEIMELRDLCREFVEGKVTSDNVNTRLSIYNQTAKRMNMLVQVAALSEKHGKGGKGETWKRLNSMNVVDGSIAIDTNSNYDKVKCPQKGGNIVTREECLDYSGENRNIDDCQQCEHFTLARKRIR